MMCEKPRLALLRLAPIEAVEAVVDSIIDQMLPVDTAARKEAEVRKPHQSLFTIGVVSPE